MENRQYPQGGDGENDGQADPSYPVPEGCGAQYADDCGDFSADLLFSGAGKTIL
ncbi:hypothetical protein D3C71_1923590 [compost metagenome]